jgi:hypothetical protein
MRRLIDPDAQHEGRPSSFGYEATRENAVAVFAKSWRRE